MDSDSTQRQTGDRRTWRAKICRCSCLAILLIAGPAFSDERPGPGEGGTVFALAVSPGDPPVLCAGTAGSGLFRSEDAGATWEAVHRGLPAEATVLTLLADPRRPRELYAGTWEQGIFRSFDGGRSWAPTGPSAAPSRVWSLHADPASPDGLYAVAGTGALLRSGDRGATWSPEQAGLPAGVVVLALTAPGKDTPTLLAGTLRHGLWRRSGLGGWRRVDIGDEVPGVWSLTASPQEPTTVYAGTLGQGVYRSTDGGATWQPRSRGLASFTEVFDLAVDPGIPEIVYAVTDRGLFRSVDGGGLWRPAGRGSLPPGVLTLAIDPRTPATLHAGTVRGGVFVSQDGGSHWRPANRGLTAKRLAALPRRITARGGDSPNTAAAPSSRPADHAHRVPRALAPLGDLRITEADVNQAGHPDAAEFVEIWNPGTEPIHLGAYHLVHLAYNWWSLLIQRRTRLPDLILAPGEFFVLCRNRDQVPSCGADGLYELNDANGVLAIVRNEGEDPDLDVLVDSFVYHQFYAHGMPPGPQGLSWLQGAVQPQADGTNAVIAPTGMGYARSCREGRLSTQGDSAADFEIAPITPGASSCLGISFPGDRVFADRVCVGVAWGCAEPEALSVALDGSQRGRLDLRRPGLDGRSTTLCASTGHLADGDHDLAVTLECHGIPCTASSTVHVVNTGFRLRSAETDRRRYRAAEKVTIALRLSRDVDEVRADFSAVDPEFEPQDVTITSLGVGRYRISYSLPLFPSVAAGTYRVPIEFRDGAVRRTYEGLRIAYVGQVDILLEPADTVPSRTVVGRFRAPGGSPLRITSLDADATGIILPMTTVGFHGRVEAPFLEGRPRAEVAAALRGVSLVIEETVGGEVGSYRIRPAMLEPDCEAAGERICHSATFDLELRFPLESNSIAEPGPTKESVVLTLLDAQGRASTPAAAELWLLALDESVYFGTPQDGDGAERPGTLGHDVAFQLAPEGNPATLILTWDGENGPGANLVPGVDGLPHTLDALDLNIGLAKNSFGGRSHVGWFGRLGPVQLVRKSNTCFTDPVERIRENCVCGDASAVNMEILTYPPGSELDEGIDGEGTLRAEYYIYDSCGSRRDTIATLTAYYCGIAEQHRYLIEAKLSEERMDLDTNFGSPPNCDFGVTCFGGDPLDCCHEPKRVPTGMNSDTGGFYPAFEFNPSRCAERPVLHGTIDYKAPVNFAVNDPSRAGDLYDPDPALDRSWSYFVEDLDASDWHTFAAPYVKVEARLSDGDRRVVGTTYTDEDGDYEMLLDADYDAGGSGEVDVVVYAETAPPFDLRVVENAPDDPVQRAVLATAYDPVEAAGRRLDLRLNLGPDDEAGKEAAAAFHMLRNSLLAAEWLFENTGLLAPPYTLVYSRSNPVLGESCAPISSVYTLDARNIVQSIAPGTPRRRCPAHGDCPADCEVDPNLPPLAENRNDFSYDQHMHELVHHFTTTLTRVRPPEDPFPGPRATGSHWGNASQRTALTEGLGSALGGVLTSALIDDLVGPGTAMSPVSLRCNEDDLADCDVEAFESLDWLNRRDDGGVVRPGPDWQPQKDCPPGDPGCGCYLGTCTDAGHVCHRGYCVDPAYTCPPGLQGCRVGFTGCQSGSQLAENDGYCVLPLTYSDGDVWRVLWDLLDEGEDVQPEVSHWRTSQMSSTTPMQVSDPYDTFGDVRTFLRVLIDAFGIDATQPVATDRFHPNLGDLLDRWRCEAGPAELAALDDYLAATVEFPYHDPTSPCPGP